MTDNVARAALAAVAALYVELVEAGVLTPEEAAQAISNASASLSALPGAVGETAVPLLDGLALNVRGRAPRH